MQQPQRKRKYKTQTQRRPKRIYKKPKKSFYQIKVDRPRKETKCVTNPFSNTDFMNMPAGVVESMFRVDLGPGNWQRVGNQIVLKSIHFRCQIIDPQAVMPDRTYRICIIYDKVPGAAPPAIGDIFADVGSTGTIYQQGFSGLNLQQKNRYSIIREYVRTYARRTNQGGNDYADDVTPNMPVLTGKNSAQNYIEDYIKLPRLPTTYKTIAEKGTIDNITSGAYYLCFFGSDTAGNTPGLGWACRFKYDDV